jgi:hypothetical protein
MEETILLESIYTSWEECLDLSLDSDRISDSESQVLRNIDKERESW